MEYGAQRNKESENGIRLQKSIRELQGRDDLIID
jgi:hypothetical protein